MKRWRSISLGQGLRLPIIRHKIKVKGRARYRTGKRKPKPTLRRNIKELELHKKIDDTEAETESKQCSVKSKAHEQINLDLTETSDDALFVLKEPTLSTEPPRKKRKQIQPMSSQQRAYTNDCKNINERKYDSENEKSNNMGITNSDDNENIINNATADSDPCDAELRNEGQVSHVKSNAENISFPRKENRLQDEDHKNMIESCKTTSKSNIVQVHLKSVDIAKSKMKLLIIELDKIISQRELELQKLYSQKAKAMKRLKILNEQAKGQKNIMNGDHITQKKDVHLQKNEKSNISDPRPPHNNKSKMRPVSRNVPDVPQITRSNSVAKLLKDKIQNKRKLKSLMTGQNVSPVMYPGMNYSTTLQHTNVVNQNGLTGQGAMNTNSTEIVKILNESEFSKGIAYNPGVQNLPTKVLGKTILHNGNSERVGQEWRRNGKSVSHPILTSLYSEPASGSILHYYGTEANIVTNSNSNGGTVITRNGPPMTFNICPKSKSIPDITGKGNSPMVPAVVVPYPQMMPVTQANNNMYPPIQQQKSIPVTTALKLPHNRDNQVKEISLPGVTSKKADGMQHMMEHLNQMQKMLVKTQPPAPMGNLHLVFGMSICSLCSKPSQFVCAACKKVWYCSKECQVCK